MPPVRPTTTAWRWLKRQLWLNVPVRECIRWGLRWHGTWERLARRWTLSGAVPVRVNGVSLRLHSRLDDWNVQYLYYGLPWETAERTFWASISRSAACVLDVGANAGLFSFLAAAHQPAAQVHAFEPSPRIYPRLERNRALNRFANVTLHEVAVGNSQETVTLHLPDTAANTGIASVNGAFTAAHGTKTVPHRVPQITLDAFAATLQRPIDLIKIDVEGYEYAVLQGAQQVLNTHKPVVLLELFDPEVLAAQRPELALQLGQDYFEASIHLLQTAGYCAYALQPTGLLRVDAPTEVLAIASNWVWSTRRTTARWVPYSQAASLLPVRT